MKPLVAGFAGPSVAETVPAAAAGADKVAALADETATMVAPAGTPVPVIVRPTSLGSNVAAGAVSAVEPAVVVIEVDLGSLVRPTAIGFSFK